MRFRYVSVTLLLALGINSSASAMSNKNWATVSDITNGVLIVGALGLPAYRSDWEGFQQGAYSLGAAEGMAMLGKATVHEERPDHSDNKSFPSSHTALSFASATTYYRRYDDIETAIPAFLLATLTGIARVEAKKHHWYDAVAGAAIGTGSGWFFTDAFNKTVQLVPWVEGGGGGLVAVVKW